MSSASAQTLKKRLLRKSIVGEDMNGAGGGPLSVDVDCAGDELGTPIILASDTVP